MLPNNSAEGCIALSFQTLDNSDKYEEPRKCLLGDLNLYFVRHRTSWLYSTTCSFRASYQCQTERAWLSVERFKGGDLLRRTVRYS